MLRRCATVLEVGKNLQVDSVKSKPDTATAKTSEKAQNYETDKSCLS